MSEIITYITQIDTHPLLEWINNEADMAWIILDERNGLDYRWKAVHEIAELVPGEYCLWHSKSAALSIPSGSTTVRDVRVLSPFDGWTQKLSTENAQVPWFGATAPGPYMFTFNEHGSEQRGAIGRSGFSWPGNYFRPIGHAADAESKKWWGRLRRFVQKSSIGIPWPPKEGGRTGAYAFPDAYAKYRGGTHLDVNPHPIEE